MEKVNAYLQITMKIKENDRPSAAKVYFDYREPFLQTIDGALTKNLLVRDEDVQVPHGFDSKEHAAVLSGVGDVQEGCSQGTFSLLLG